MKLKRPFCTLVQDPEAKTLVFTLSSDLPAPHTGSLHCATDLGHPNSSSCLWDAPLDSQEPLISSEMEKQFQAIGSGSAVSSSDKVPHFLASPLLISQMLDFLLSEQPLAFESFGMNMCGIIGRVFNLFCFFISPFRLLRNCTFSSQDLLQKLLCKKAGLFIKLRDENHPAGAIV